MRVFINLIFLSGCAIVFSQEKAFKSNNGFSGTFELIGGGIKPNSIIIEKFKTSVGEFSGSELENQGILFPFKCFDCSFDFNGIAGLANVKNTTGPGFRKIIEAARVSIKKKDDDLVIESCLKKMGATNSVKEKKKILFSAYRKVYDKKRIEKMLAQLNTAKNLKNTVLKAPLKKKDTITNSFSSTALKTGEPSQGFESPTGQNIFPTKDPNKNELSKCQRKLVSLSQKRNKALTNKDVVIIGELDMAIQRLKKKCNILQVSASTEKGVNTQIDSGVTLITPDNHIKEMGVSAGSIEKLEAEKKSKKSEPVGLAQTNQRQVSTSNFENSPFEGMIAQQLMEKEQLHKKAIQELENKIIEASKTSNFDLAEELMTAIAEERQKHRLTVKELRKSKRFSGKQVTKGELKQIDSPRIFF